LRLLPLMGNELLHPGNALGFAFCTTGAEVVLLDVIPVSADYLEPSCGAAVPITTIVRHLLQTTLSPWPCFAHAGGHGGSRRWKHGMHDDVAAPPKSTPPALLPFRACCGSVTRPRVAKTQCDVTKMEQQLGEKASEKSDLTVFDRYALPPPEKLREIEAKQEERAREIKRRRAEEVKKTESLLETQERGDAARLIQRNYRGYRDRRALKGYGLDPSTRWIEVLREGMR
jgi:hypothetical protein